MKKNTMIGCCLALMSLSSNVIANEISYNYIQGGYASVTVDLGGGFDWDADGVGASGSLAVSPNMALIAGFAVTSFDRILGIDTDTTEVSFGVQGHTSVAQGTDLTASFSILLADIELTDGFTTVSDDDTGNIISVGIRHMPSSAIELNAGVSRADVFDDSSTATSFGARFYTNEKFSFGLGYSTGDDVDTFVLSLRVDV